MELRARVWAIVSLLLVFSLLMAQAPTASAMEAGYPVLDSSKVDSVLSRYLSVETELKGNLASPDACAYWTQAEFESDDTFGLWCINLASWILDVQPDENMYLNIFANLSLLLQSSIEEGVYNQQGIDDIKDFDGVSRDILDIALSGIGEGADQENLFKIIDGVELGASNIIDSLGEAQYYQTVFLEYSAMQTLLEAVSAHSDNSMLVDIASSLIEVNDALLSSRLEYLSNTPEDLSVFDRKFFVENLSIKLLDDNMSEISESARTFIEVSAGLIPSYTALIEIPFRTTISAGDLLFGTTNCFVHFNEIVALADIADALVCELEKMPDIPQAGGGDTLRAVNERCAIYRSLIAVHSRGEYSMHELLTSDAGVLGIIMNPPGGSVDQWYEDRVNALARFAGLLEEFLSADVFSDAESAVAGIEKGVSYSYENDGYFASFRVSSDGGDATLLYYSPGVSSTVEDFYFDWVDGKKAYELIGYRSNKSFDVSFKPLDDGGLRITTICTEPYYQWEGGIKGETLWSDAVFFQDAKADGDASPAPSVSEISQGELIDYIGSPIHDLAARIPGMRDEGVTAGIGYTNNYIIIESGREDGGIDFISLEKESGFTLLGLYCGMGADEANSILDGLGATENHYIANTSGTELRVYTMPNGMRVNLYSDSAVRTISVFASS